MKFFNNIDLNKNQLVQAVIQTAGSAPGTPVTGQIYFDTGLNRLQIRGNSAWGLTALDSDLLNGQNAAYYLSRANHTGTQLSSTISDLAATVQAYRLDQFAAPTAAVSFNNQRITNLADPSSAADAATMSWVQTQVTNAAAGIDAKPSVRAASTANLTLSGTQTIDGVAVGVGERVLAKNQTTTADNGPYIVAAGAWSRATDGDATGEITPGASWFVEEGTVNGKTLWRVENTGTITLGTTGLTINQVSAGTTYTGSLGVQLVGSDFRAQVVASGGISAVAGGLQIDTAIVPRKYSVDIGNGSLTTITVTHNLGTKDVTVAIRQNSDDAHVFADIVSATTNTITIAFSVAPASNALRVTVIG